MTDELDDSASDDEVTKILQDLSKLGLTRMAMGPLSELRGLAQDYFCKRPSEDENDRLEEGLSPINSSSSSHQKLEETEESSEEEDFPLFDTRPTELFRNFESICSCHLGPRRTPCFTQFERKIIEDNCLQHLNKSNRTMDLIIMSKLTSHQSALDMMRRSKEIDPQPDKHFGRLHGLPICRTFFLFLHGISKERLRQVADHLFHYGLSHRPSKYERPKQFFSVEEAEVVCLFLLNFGKAHAIQMRGNRPAHWKHDVFLLPLEMTKKYVYDFFCLSTMSSNIGINIGFGKFCGMWRELAPFLLVTRPTVDLCCMCDNLTQIVGTQRFEAGLAEAVEELSRHYSFAEKENTFYHNLCSKTNGKLMKGLSLSPHSACSLNRAVHYSFGFAQDLLYPICPFEPGPLFQKHPRRCGLFGVTCQSISAQVTFLLEEAIALGESTDHVVSLLHFFFENFALGESEVHLSADSHNGLSKTDCLLQYLAWRVYTKRHLKVKISFVMTGHTRLSCDWFFGLVKRTYRRSRVDCLNDLVRVVTESCPNNIAQKCGTEDGTSLVPFYSWTTFLQPFFHPVMNIAKYKHFQVSLGNNKLTMKEYADSTPESQNFFKENLSCLDPKAMPKTIDPSGLSVERQWYLHDDIRSLVNPVFKDLVAPKPLCKRSKEIKGNRPLQKR